MSMVISPRSEMGSQPFWVYRIVGRGIPSSDLDSLSYGNILGTGQAQSGVMPAFRLVFIPLFFDVDFCCEKPHQKILPVVC